MRHFAIRIFSALVACVALAASLKEYREYEWVGAVALGALGVACCCYALFGPPVTLPRGSALRHTSPRRRSSES